MLLFDLGLIMSNFNINYINDVFVYCRVSTRAQYNDSKNGIDKQYEACERYVNCALNKQINYYHHDVGSGYNNKTILREMNKMINILSYNDVIVIHDVSRLGRNIEIAFKMLSKIRRKGCYIISVTDNVCYGKTRLLDKKFWYKIIAAEEDSDKKSERMKARIARIREKGGFLGIPPFGYGTQKMNGVPRLVKKPEEQSAIKIIKSLRNKSKTGWQIANVLNSSCNKRGKRWTEDNVNNVDVNAKYQHYKLKSKKLEESMEDLRI